MGKLSQNKISKYRIKSLRHLHSPHANGIYPHLSQPCASLQRYINLLDLRNSAAHCEAGSFSQGCEGAVQV